VAAVIVAAGFLGTIAPASAAYSLEKAKEFADSGDTKAAIIELKNALQADGNDVEARLLLGSIYLKLRDGAAAEKEIRRAANLGADPSRWRLDLVEALLAQGKFSDALDRLEAANDLPEQGQSRAMALRGQAYLGLKRLDEAAEAYDASLSLDPDNTQAALGKILLAVQSGRDDEAMAAAEDLLSRVPDDGEARLVRADLYRKKGENAKAEQDFARAIALLPEDARPLLGHAIVLLASGNLDGAKKDLDRVDSIRKDIVMARYLRGLIAFQEKDWDAAKGHLERVLAVAPGHLQSQLLLGIISFSEGDLTIADEYLTRVVAAFPGNSQAVKVLAATQIRKREPTRAIETLKPLANSQYDAQIMALLGSAYLLSGDHEKGQEWLSKAVDATPDVAALRTQFALTLLAGGQTDKAITELQSAVDLDQDIIQADVLLVLAHLKDKQYDQALAASQALEKRLPDQPIPYNLTGLAYLAEGDKTKARERFKKALEVDSKFVTAELNLARVDVADGDLDAAEKRFERVLFQERGHLGALLGMAGLAERRGDDKALVAFLEKAQEANPGSVQPGLLLARYYITHNEHEKAASVGTDLYSRFPDNEQVLEMLARAQSLQGDTASSIRTFEQLAQLRPGDAQLQYLLGGAKWKAKDLAGARQAFQRAVGLEPAFVDARWALASVELQDGNIGGALDQARSLQADFPELPLGYRIEGEIYFSQKRPAEAVKALEIAYQKEKSGPVAIQLAQAYGADNRRGRAIDILEAWLSQQPDDQRARSLLAVNYQLEGRDQEAIAAYEVLKDSAKDNAVVLNNLAWLYQKAGDERALEVARQAFDLDPNRPEIADTYGWVLLQQGNTQESLTILQQAYVAFPTQPEIGYHVAVALHQAGRDDEAVKVLRRLLRETPDFEQEREAKALLQKIDE